MRNYIEVKMCMTFRKKIIEFSFDTTFQKFGVSKISFLKILVLLYSKDALN